MKLTDYAKKLGKLPVRRCEMSQIIHKKSGMEKYQERGIESRCQAVGLNYREPKHEIGCGDRVYISRSGEMIVGYSSVSGTIKGIDNCFINGANVKVVAEEDGDIVVEPVPILSDGYSEDVLEYV